MSLFRELLGGAIWLAGWAVLLAVAELGVLDPRVKPSESTCHRLRLLAMLLSLVGLLLLQLSIWFWIAWAAVTLLIAHSYVGNILRRSQAPPEE